MLRSIIGPVVATVVTAATGVLIAPAPPATAAACGAAGVTAVVDFNGLGGNQATVGCDGDGGGRPASEVFRDAGYTLSYSQAPGMNGFVCKIQGQPTDGDCAQNDSFWSLWWSDGTSGRWVFSSQGASTLDVPDGGSVAFAWHEGTGNAQPPDVAPPVHDEPSPTPTSNGTGPGSGGGGGRHHGNGGPASPPAPSTSSATSAPTPGTPSASPTGKKAKHGHHGDRHAKKREHRKHRKHRKHGEPSAGAPTPSATPAAGEVTAGPPADTSGDDGGSSFPVWLGAGIAVVVLGAAIAVPVLRRRAG